MLSTNPAWQLVLQAYLDDAKNAPVRPEGEGGTHWSDRVEAVEGVQSSDLSAIHGQLIALGWLKFEFEVGQSGLSYRVSSDGRAVLDRVQRGDFSFEFVEQDDDFEDEIPMSARKSEVRQHEPELVVL
ncbi:hypothetical protein SH668x_002639 [Planctomicrobium sp. SH668]|uniref:hypothetical protein n=1 Tax=Planctomicrobium sp. SH668 TaxID=3448126 RepID=UPI003F5B44F2